jgi:hypothetical protein
MSSMPLDPEAADRAEPVNAVSPAGVNSDHAALRSDAPASPSTQEERGPEGPAKRTLF